MFFDEEMLLDLRLNILNKYVHKFVITEATYMHSGKTKKLIFDINPFSKFKDKIIYIVVDKQPANLEIINENDSNDTKGSKLINNSVKRENFQREMAKDSLDKSADEDIILINDIDEIPNLNEINFNNISKKIISNLQIEYFLCLTFLNHCGDIKFFFLQALEPCQIKFS